MLYSYSVENNCLIINLNELVEDLSFISPLYLKGCKHLILNLSQLSQLDVNDIAKFSTFGNNLVGINSFVMISNQILDENFSITPTLQEAFDIIELEDIERILNL
jgi:hypothetical protein